MLAAKTKMANNTTMARWRRAAASSFRYARSMPPRNPSMALPTRPLPVCVRRKRDDSMGVSVKATKSETETAKATVRPNCTKKRPMMPFIVATGTNTARIDAVVAMTASPISAVASLAAFMGDLPISKCR